MTHAEEVLLVMLVLSAGVIALMHAERRLARAVRRAIPLAVRRGQVVSVADRPSSRGLEQGGVREQLSSSPARPATPPWAREVPMPARHVQHLTRQDTLVHEDAQHLDDLAAHAHPGNREPAADSPDPTADHLTRTADASLAPSDSQPAVGTVPEQSSGQDDAIRAILEYDKANGLETDAWAKRRGDVLRVKPAFGPVFEIAAREARCLAAQLLRGADEIIPPSSKSCK